MPDAWLAGECRLALCVSSVSITILSRGLPRHCRLQRITFAYSYRHINLKNHKKIQEALVPPEHLAVEMKIIGAKPDDRAVNSSRTDRVP
jgi:hypothetical protein